MTDHDTTNNAYQAKVEYRKQRANESFEKKLRAVVRMQQLEYNIAQSTGRKCAKPWHSKKQREE
jgi:hypothetical protein